MRFSGFIRFLKDNILMIAVTLAAILFYKFLIPLDIKSFLLEYAWPIGLTFFAVMMCALFLPAGIQMLRQAKNGEVNVGPLTPGKIIDTIPVLDEDGKETGFQYVVSFVSKSGSRALGFTQVLHGEQKYHKGASVNLWDIAKQEKPPGASQDPRPTYDVDLWDEQSAADDLKANKVYGWLIVGLSAFWVLAALVAVCLHLPYFAH